MQETRLTEFKDYIKSIVTNKLVVDGTEAHMISHLYYITVLFDVFREQN